MKPHGQGQSVWPRLLGYFLAAMLLLTLLSRAADAIMLPIVQCERALPGALSHKVMLSGVIEAEEQWPVLAEADIAVDRVYVRAGQRVRAGETLLRYDAQRLERMLDEKQTQLKKLTLQARLDALEQPAAGDGKDGAQAQDDASEAEKRALKMQLGRLEIEPAQRDADRLSRLVYGGAILAAPVEGVISEVIAKPGDTVSGAAFRLSPASSALIVRTVVTPDQMKYLAAGMEARFQRSGDARFSEEAAVLKGISPAQAGYEAYFTLPDGAGGIGQAVSIVVTQNTPTYGMRVPLGAIADNGGTKGVYRIRRGQSVLGDMEYAEFVAISVIENDAQYAAIDASLSDQDQVIVSSSKPVGTGERVRSSS